MFNNPSLTLIVPLQLNILVYEHGLHASVYKIMYNFSRDFKKLYLYMTSIYIYDWYT